MNKTPKPEIHCSFDRLEKLEKLVPHPSNPNRHSEKQIELLAKIIDAQGWRAPIVVSEHSGFIVAGHARQAAAQKLGVESAPVNFQAFESDAEEHAHLVADNRVAELAEIDRGALADLLQTMEGEIDLELAGFDSVSLDGLLEVEKPLVDSEPQIELAAELEKKWGTAAGQMWRLGDHLIACGDCTEPRAVAALMGKEKAVLLHADPPYGMGKEKDGVANDNIYREKLDAFQMEWWRSCRPTLEDTASVYIWGNAPDLWRLWYAGGLGAEPDVLLRNELVWNKGTGFGMASALMHSYTIATERCLFFMLGQQFIGNQNADEYWEGYEPLRLWLVDEVEKVGWKSKDINDLTKSHMAGHYLTKSQFAIISRKNYDLLRKAAAGAAFELSYDDLFAKFFPDVRKKGNEYRRELSAELRESRSPFDNAHDSMTDVWAFDRVYGEERFGHATPKPVAMMARCIKSSAPSGSVVLEPFLGTGSTLMGCESTGRKCRALEIEPRYVAVAIDRWHTSTGKEPQLIQ